MRINGEMHNGLQWKPADKSPGSRQQGFVMIREMLINAAPDKETRRRERPGLFLVEDALPQTLRTLPVLPRDKRNPDDVDSKSEDHVFDAMRYLIYADRGPRMRIRRYQ